MDKFEEILKPLSVVITFALAVVARNLLNEEKIKFRAFIGEMILSVIFGLLLIFTGLVQGSTYAETMVIACGCGLGINRSVQWIALGFINRFVPKGGK
ncbi:TMhelix containing protein [Vibrio phage 1.205.O._10N.222.51.A7]|nr:TMhelix containing protein [Vibrio phage 1.205.O._10N.222.51.A7]